jgi:hypothetical protein
MAKTIDDETPEATGISALVGAIKDKFKGQKVIPYSKIDQLFGEYQVTDDDIPDLIDALNAEGMDLADESAQLSTTQKILLGMEPRAIIEEANIELQLGAVHGNSLLVNWSGHQYEYEPLGMTAAEFKDKITKLMKYSVGKAALWMKKNARLVSGGKG